ncbi:chitinase [Apiospora aurea]|uniref:Chitinase n=1 Tax=Apiospora aurea TaxID=335848 RepID=A0ABR1QLM8_9PEZI
MLLFTLPLLGLLLAPVVAQECSADVPCKTGCCSKFGYCGLGPSCHERVLIPLQDCEEKDCVNNCERKAQCGPGGFGEDFVEKTACPLNVCCSKHGFCGTTEAFCGKKRSSAPAAMYFQTQASNVLSGTTNHGHPVAHATNSFPSRSLATFTPISTLLSRGLTQTPTSLYHPEEMTRTCT